MKKSLLACLLIVLSTAILAVYVSNADAVTKKDESLRRGEHRATLDPKLFSDARVRAAYQVAKQIPWVLDSIYCFCHCEDAPFRHKSLLTCYVDDHASV
jgi:hypothetical protein